VRRDLLRAAKALVWPTIALAVVIAFAPGRVELAARIYALVAAGVLLLVLLAVLRRSYPPARPLRPDRKAPSSDQAVPPSLARVEQEVALGVSGSFDLHHRLRPRLRALATELLGSRRGVSVDDAPDRARELLGDETWELVRPDRPPPDDRLARGLPINEIGRVVESLERL
jgi:hypothetical protein